MVAPNGAYSKLQLEIAKEAKFPAEIVSGANMLKSVEAADIEAGVRMMEELWREMEPTGMVFGNAVLLHDGVVKTPQSSPIREDWITDRYVAIKNDFARMVLLMTRSIVLYPSKIAKSGASMVVPETLTDDGPIGLPGVPRGTSSIIVLGGLGQSTLD